ncbi:hypothetical protein VST7929_01857 [Vibrio stylophorae]|uniref:Acyl-CoA thioesterase n=1 Tax=Vibrio stylophorae TaxID=659351 RepID=A0ABN8DT20_9VIBR|nr:hypothetical protein VST7929_01857 [Vibrio stylophorae]
MPILSAEVQFVVPFQDADPMGVVWHGNYFRYFEEARRVLMDKMDYGYRQMQASGYLWPIIDTRVKYVRSVPFGTEIRVTADLTEWENRLRVDYRIYDAQTGQCLNKAHTLQVAVEEKTGEMCFMSPDVFRKKLEPYL